MALELGGFVTLIDGRVTKALPGVTSLLMGNLGGESLLPGHFRIFRILRHLGMFCLIQLQVTQI